MTAWLIECELTEIIRVDDLAAPRGGELAGVNAVHSWMPWRPAAKRNQL